jgi:alpha-glucosidase (family GH31 glycosyl hydrolase)
MDELWGGVRTPWTPPLSTPLIDPHIKVETGYSVYDGALEKDLFVKNADGSNFEGTIW